jgi:hypothetical protein
VAGSCHGGSHSGTYQFIHDTGFIPFDTCMPYMACSEESTEGFCEHVDTTCSAINTCRTCDTFAGNGGACAEVRCLYFSCIYFSQCLYLFTMSLILFLRYFWLLNSRFADWLFS